MSPRILLDLLVNDFVCRAVTTASWSCSRRTSLNSLHIAPWRRAFLPANRKVHDEGGHVQCGPLEANISKAELCEAHQAHVPAFVYLERLSSMTPQARYIVSNSRIEAKRLQPAHSLDDGIRDSSKGFRMIAQYRLRQRLISRGAAAPPAARRVDGKSAIRYRPPRSRRPATRRPWPARLNSRIVSRPICHPRAQSPRQPSVADHAPRPPIVLGSGA